MKDEEILKELQSMKLSFKEPTLFQIATWSLRMRADIKKWFEGGPKPEFLRVYERK